MSARVRLTPQLQMELVALLELGLPVERACDAAGIAAVTYRAWRSRSGAQYNEFRRETDAARARGEAQLVGRIVAQTSKSWRAAAWLLQNAYGWSAKVQEPAPTERDADPLADVIDMNRRRRERPA